jgi:phospholipase/carboxylesterase
MGNITVTPDTTLETHIIEPAGTPIGTVIWMHGLGADNRNFDPLIPALCDQGKLPLRFIFPNAPIRPVSINYNTPMRAWYDIYSLSDLSREDKTGVHTSQAAISTLIHTEMERGMPASRIVLAGFSQGGAMALYTGLRQQTALAGILALSCYLPLIHEHTPDNITHVETPIFMAHGTHDTVLPRFAGKMAFDTILRTHPAANWHEYPMGHEITFDETKDIQQWLARIFQ